MNTQKNAAPVTDSGNTIIFEYCPYGEMIRYESEIERTRDLLTETEEKIIEELEDKNVSNKLDVYLKSQSLLETRDWVVSLQADKDLQAMKLVFLQLHLQLSQISYDLFVHTATNISGSLIHSLILSKSTN